MKNQILLVIIYIFINITFYNFSYSAPTYYEDFYSIAGSLNKVYFVDEDLIYVIGDFGMLLESKDGGKSWKHIPLKVSNPVNDIKHVKNTIVLICNNGEVVSSKDKGVSWQYNYLLINKGGLRALSLVSESKWIISGDYAIHISYDGGENWITKKNDIQFSFQLFANSSVIVVSDRTNKILFSYDDGDNWQKNNQLEVECIKSRVKIIKQISNSSFGILLNNKLAISYNNGNSFSFQNLNLEYKNFYFQENQFYGIKELIGVVKDFIEIYKEDFSKQDTNRFSSSVDTSYGLDFNTSYLKDFAIYENKCFAVGSSKTIITSTDYGKNWIIVSNLDAGYRRSSFEFINRNSKYLFIGAYRSKLFRSSDEGATWLPQKNNKLTKNRSIHKFFIDENGEGMFYSTDYGNSLTPRYGYVSNNGEKMEYIDHAQYNNDSPEYIFKKIGNIYCSGQSTIQSSQTRIMFMNEKAQKLKIVDTDSIDIAELNIIDTMNIEGWGNDFKGIKPFIQGAFYQYSSVVHFSTTDGGNTWKKDTIGKNEKMRWITYISPSNNQKMFLVCNNNAIDTINFNYLESYTEKVYESNDFGKTWLELSSYTGKPQRNDEPLWLSYFVLQKNELYAFNSTGTYFKYDPKGKKWDIVVNDNDDYYYYGSYYNKLTNENTILLSNNNYNPTIIKSYNASQDTTSIEDIEVSDDKRALLYSSTPYPIPARSKIQSRIYWNQIYQISDADLSVYDIFGNKLLAPNVYIDASEAYTGILTWECDNIDTGIYFIRVSLQNETINIPVTVYR